MNLGPGVEFDRIRAILGRLAELLPNNQALGDDCALVPFGDTTLALSIDASLEGVHFRTDWLDFKEIGFRAAGAALSDLAAEGATPVGLLVTLGLPAYEGRGADPAVEIMEGVAAMAGNVGAQILGGDLTRSERYTIDICVLGSVARPVRRSGAREGDALWVTGYLGGAALALERLRAGKAMDKPLHNRYACPEPRLDAGRWLAREGATAMIDISDGLVADAQHLAAASEVGIEINLERIPLWENVDAMAAASSGEEFELLLTMPPVFGDASASSFRAETGVHLTRIGTCLRGAGGRRGGVRLLDHNKPVPLPAGYDHFAL
ncbi:MAG TPA: thiamine-phosphate kinase [Gemmatimonadales bacterium]|nr:thiamine-phosphate kinase [Gemmatimonadales bacterium]